MPGQWVEDPDYPSGWRWDTRAPAGDPSVTRISRVYAGGPPMPRDDQNAPRSVYDPTIGADGGGRYADPAPVPAIDPDHPVDHVGQLSADPDGLEHWTGSAPFGTGHGAASGADLVACPTCGTGVHPDRLRD